MSKAFLIEVKLQEDQNSNQNYYLNYIKTRFLVHYYFVLLVTKYVIYGII